MACRLVYSRMTSYTVSVFKTLADIHTTWPLLQRHLENGLGLRVISCGNDLFIIRSTSSSETSEPWCRSVVWNGATNRPLCVAPPHRREDLPPDVSSCVAQTFLEGTLINAFRDASGVVQIASRSKLGATGTFYSKRSFGELLTDALKGQDLQTILPEGAQFASFLLQHPEHRIVAPLTEPALHLIHSGTVAEDGTVRIQENEALEQVTLPFLPTTQAEYQQLMAQLAEQRGYTWQGLVLKDGQGGRWRFRSNSYTMVRTLRGDMSRSDVRFLKLRSQQLVDTYLYYYPEDRQALWAMEQTVRSLTGRLYGLYVSCHIRHDISFSDLPAHWKTHVYALHNQYLTVLKPQGFFVRKQEAIRYINELAFQRILHLIKSEKPVQQPQRQHLFFEADE